MSSGQAADKALARTHAAGALAFGNPPAGHEGDGSIGRQPMTIRPGPRWGSFYAEQRLLPHARRARDRRHLSPSGAAAVERVCAWPGLVGLHPLHPLLVHAASHGPAYGAEAEGVARRYAG